MTTAWSEKTALQVTQIMVHGGAEDGPVPSIATSMAAGSCVY
jgi:hypothetical protein